MVLRGTAGLRCFPGSVQGRMDGTPRCPCSSAHHPAPNRFTHDRAGRLGPHRATHTTSVLWIPVKGSCCSSGPWEPFPGSPPPECTSSEQTRPPPAVVSTCFLLNVLHETKKITWGPSVIVSGTHLLLKLELSRASVSPNGKKEDSQHTGRWGE